MTGTTIDETVEDLPVEIVEFIDATVSKALDEFNIRQHIKNVLCELDIGKIVVEALRELGVEVV